MTGDIVAAAERVRLRVFYRAAATILGTAGVNCLGFVGAYAAVTAVYVAVSGRPAAAPLVDLGSLTAVGAVLLVTSWVCWRAHRALPRPCPDRGRPAGTNGSWLPGPPTPAATRWGGWFTTGGDG